MADNGRTNWGHAINKNRRYKAYSKKAFKPADQEIRDASKS